MDNITITIGGGSCLDEGACHQAFLVPVWFWAAAGGLLALVVVTTLVLLLRARAH